MPGNYQERLSHLYIVNTAATEPYTSPSTRGPIFRSTPRQRETHGQLLARQFDTIRQQSQATVEEQTAYGIDAKNGIYLQFESEPNFALKFESLEAQRSGIELLAVRYLEGSTVRPSRLSNGCKVSWATKVRELRALHNALPKSGTPKPQYRNRPS
jgi:hypothetical protein